MSLRPLEILIWDVNHGNSTSICLPNGKTIMLDCAANPVTGFSPIWRTRERWKGLDYLIISHPHMDHISDIMNIEHLKPHILQRPRINHQRLLEDKEDVYKDIIDYYIDFESGYNQPIPDHQNPSSTNWSGDVKIETFSLNGEQSDLNDYSIVTFLSYGGFTFAYAGDLTSNGWERLIEQEGVKFTNLLKRTNFFEVSHHGRKEGYNPIIFDYMTDMKLGFVSDKHEQTTSVTSSYSQFCKGWRVNNEVTGEHMDERKVLTTRADGRIKITVDVKSDATEVGVSTLDHTLL